jgi:CheY-like chemotaxis protein
MELFKNVRRQVASQLDQMKLGREIEQLAQMVRENPGNVEALRQLAEKYQEAGNVEAAVAHFLQLADLYRTTKQHELALAFYRKVEKLVDSSQRATVLKQIVNIHFDTRQFDKAYEYSRQVISLYLNDQQSDAAAGFLKMLPGFGEKDADYRKELREMIQERNEKWMQGAKATWVSEDGTGQQKTEDFSDRLVLLVDDEPHVLMILEKIIKPLGCQIVTAPNGLDALDLARATPPALIISDLMMPKMDGSQLFAALQQDPNLSKIPFVCLSSRAQEDEKVSALEQGVEDYWGKPFSVKEIPLKVKRILRRTPTLTRISGQLSQTSVTDLLNQMERERKDGVLKIVTPRQQSGAIHFKDGSAFDAECGASTGLNAIIRMINWSEGSYSFTQQAVTRENKIQMRAAELILEALHRYDEEQALLSSMPSRHLPATFPPDYDVSWFAGSPKDLIRKIGMLVDGKRTVGDCIDQCQDDLEMLRMLATLWSAQARDAFSPQNGMSGTAPGYSSPQPPPPAPPLFPTVPPLVPQLPQTGYGQPLQPPQPPTYGGGYTQPPTYPPAYPPPAAAYPQQPYPPPQPPPQPPPYTSPYQNPYGGTSPLPPQSQPGPGYGGVTGGYGTTPLTPPPSYPAPPAASAPAPLASAPPIGGGPPPHTAMPGPDFSGGNEYRVTFSDPAREEHLARQLYDAVVTAKRMCNEALDDFTFARFHRILCEQATRIKAQLNCTHIAFSVTVDSGRVKFIAKGL